MFRSPFIGISTLALSAFAVVFGASSVQCSSGRAEFVTPPAPAPTGEFVAPPDGGSHGEAGVNALPECAGENTQIYVLTPMPPEIHRFDPETLTFTRAGALNCTAMAAGIGTWSMAIDRRGVAWVLLQGGSMVQVRLDTFECKDLVLNDRPTDLDLFGMGFAKDDSPTGETLYLHRRLLFKVDPTTRDVSLIGETATPTLGELTGRGDGQLFGFSPQSGVITQFDKTNAKTIASYRTAALDQSEFAFAQWGGDFWIFTRPQGATHGTVTQYSPKTDETKVVVEDTGLRIIGAGVSTCAPYEPVK